MIPRRIALAAGLAVVLHLAVGVASLYGDSEQAPTWSRLPMLATVVIELPSRSPPAAMEATASESALVTAAVVKPIINARSTQANDADPAPSKSREDANPVAVSTAYAPPPPPAYVPPPEAPAATFMPAIHAQPVTAASISTAISCPREEARVAITPLGQDQVRCPPSRELQEN